MPRASETQRERTLEWMDLRALQLYACVSERTLREWIHRAENPLPAVQVEKKILVRRSQFDRWLESHRFVPVDSIDVGSIANEIVENLRKAA